MGFSGRDRPRDGCAARQVKGPAANRRGCRREAGSDQSGGSARGQCGIAAISHGRQCPEAYRARSCLGRSCKIDCHRRRCVQCQTQHAIQRMAALCHAIITAGIHQLDGTRRRTHQNAGVRLHHGCRNCNRHRQHKPRQHGAGDQSGVAKDLQKRHRPHYQPICRHCQSLTSVKDHRRASAHDGYLYFQSID